MVARLTLTRSQIVAFRRGIAALDSRLPPGADSLRRAAWAGLSDSMPRAALLSIHARVTGTPPDVLDDPALVQLWGPRFSAYVVAEPDAAIFSLGRFPDDERGRRRAVATADRLEHFLGGRTMTYGEAGRGIGIHPNALRYAAPTGRVRIRWEGARQPTIWTVPAPEMTPADAHRELGRRYLHVFGPATAASFSDWAGMKPPGARATFDGLAPELLAVATPIGDAWVLAADEPAIRAAEPSTDCDVRLLPSGDTWFLLQGRERELLVPDPARRASLWTPRVWPGALLLGGEIGGTWRRAGPMVSIEPWRPLTASERAAVEVEAASLPLPDINEIRVTWAG